MIHQIIVPNLSLIDLEFYAFKKLSLSHNFFAPHFWNNAMSPKFMLYWMFEHAKTGEDKDYSVMATVELKKLLSNMKVRSKG